MMITARPWTSVLEGSERDRALETIDAIASALSEDSIVENADATLANGLPGLALFFAAAEAAGLVKGGNVSRIMDRAVERSSEVSESPALFSGLTGLAWTLQHLASFVSSHHLAQLSRIDDAMLAAFERPPRQTEFDLMRGVVGLGVYAIERHESDVARQLLARLIAWLAATAEWSPIGASWRALPHMLHETARARFPDGCHYPGIAHGTAGVVGLLASVIEQGIANTEAHPLMEACVRWIDAQEAAPGTALFPHQVLPPASAPPSRFAWCTGAPGISYMLWRAGRTAGMTSWAERGTQLAREVARRPFEQLGVHDACLCHGSAGLGLLHGRWFNATGDEFFREESRRWFQRSLQYRQTDEGIAGYSAMNAPMNRREALPGLLFGAAGVGAALVSATTPHEPTWDRLFLLSDRNT